MYVTTRYEQVEPGRVRVFKQYELHGSFVPFFKLFYMRPIKRQMTGMFVGLEKEAMRRHAGQEAGR